MRLVLPMLCALAVLASAAGPAAAKKPKAPKLNAGAAAADITPPVGTPMFAYTARSRIAGPDNNADPDVGLMQVFSDPDTHLYAKSFVPSLGVHTRLKARSVVLERGGDLFALAQVDLGGIPYSMTKAVADRIAALGITEERLMISATHTHSGTGPIWGVDNMGYGVLGGDLLDPRIFNLTADGIAESIRSAHADLQPAELGTATVELRGASRNREFEPFTRNEDVPDDEAAAREASIDPDLTVIRIDSSDGDPLAVWSNFAIHATSFGDGNYLFSGDNPGYTTQIVERTLGKGVVNVWTNGNEGDISPNGGADVIDGEPVQYTPNSFAGAHMAGRRVADGILTAWEQAGESLRRKVELEAVGGHLSFDGTAADGEPVGPNPVLGMGVIAEGLCSPVENAAGPGQGWKQYLYGHPLVLPSDAPVSVWRIGDLGVTAIPSEVTKQMGLRIRAAVRDAAGGDLDRVILAGLTNGYLSYTSTPEEYDACTYEGSFTLFGRRQGPRYRDYATDLTEALLHGGERPPSLVSPFQVDQGTGENLPPQQTPDAGSPVAQPDAEVTRMQRATFSWNGGDRSTEAPRGQTFVALERLTSDGWATADTDESFADTFRRGAGNVWTETYQFGACDPLGTYRFRVTGKADRGSGPEPYELTSDAFELTAATLSIEGDRALYPDPGPEALMALPRLVMDGEATLSNGETVAVDPQTARFPVPAGATITRVEDGCGNASAAG